MRNYKQATYFLLGTGLLLILILFYQHLDQRAELLPVTENRSELRQSDPLPKTRDGACDFPPALFYAKVHKTGSSTVAAMLTKHLMRHKRLAWIKPFPNPFAGGYPGSFRAEYCVIGPKTNKLSTVWKPGKRADVLVMYHTRFEKNEIRAIMNPRAKYVAQLRNPLHQFESSFYYYYGRYAGKIYPNQPNPISCHTYPYIYITNGRWLSYQEYVKLAHGRVNESAPYFFRSRNSQAYDLGLDPSKLDKEYVLQQAKELDNTFHLVLILEHLQQSLVLLKDLLCMEWEDVIPEHKKMGVSEHTALTEKEEKIVGSLTTQDQMLYDYFNASLWRKVDAYGRERMARDVATLQMYIEKSGTQIKSLNPGTSSKVVKEYRRRPRTDPQTETKKLADAIIRTAPRTGQFAGTVEKIANYMLENCGWCPL